jgi:hypothetical protein
MKIPPRLQLVLSLLAALSVLLALGAQSLTERFYKVGYYELLANWQHARTFTTCHASVPSTEPAGMPGGTCESCSASHDDIATVRWHSI